MTTKNKRKLENLDVDIVAPKDAHVCFFQKPLIKKLGAPASLPQGVAPARIQYAHSRSQGFWQDQLSVQLAAKTLQGLLPQGLDLFADC